MARLSVQFLRRGEFHQPAQVHDSDAIRHMLDYAQIMSNEEICQAELRLQFLEQIEDLSLDRHIKG